MRMRATIASSIAITAYLLFTCLPAIAQPDEERNFLLMYFKEEDLVVESATRSPKPISQTAENVTIITARDIELMNAHTVAEVLNTVTGVEMHLTGGPGTQAVPYIHGSEMRHVTVIIDGVVLNNLGANATDVGIMPVQNIEKIEIIKGPASSAWGSALGGVVNIITKTGGTDTGAAGVFYRSHGTKNTDDFRAEAQGKNGRFGYYFYTGRLKSDGLTTHFGVSEDSDYVKLTYDITDETAVLFAFGYGKTSHGTGLDILNDVSYENSVEIIHSALALNSMLSKDVEVNVSLRALHQDFINTDNQLSTGAFLQEYTFIDKGYGASAKLTWKSRVQTVVLGADYDDKKLVSNFVVGEELRTNKWALYANDTITLDKFTVTPGIRYDDTNKNRDVLSPSLGVTYSFANRTVLRAYAAKGFSYPTLLETFLNPPLKEETVWSYQAGVETAAMKYFWVKLSAFRNEMRDAIIYANNVGRQRRQGVEVAVRTIPVYNFSLFAGAEYVAAKDLDTGLRLQYVPKNIYDLGIRYDDEQSIKALLQGRYIDWNADPIDNGKYGSFIFDLHITKKIHQYKNASFEAFADVHNIFSDSQYPIDAYKNPERWYEGGIRFKF